MATANSTSGYEPSKPYPDYPLTLCDDGRWCKRIRGRIHHFYGNAEEAPDEITCGSGTIYTRERRGR